MPDFGIMRGFNEKLFGDKLVAGQLPTQLGLIGSVAIGLLLDAYPNAAVAYSVRKLRGAYTGSAIRVRRSSDNAESDIGFSGANLDTSSLTSFCSGTNGFVTTWYDQSGNARNVTQATAANQPQIVSSGSVMLNNGKPSVYFQDSNDLLRHTGATSITSQNVTLATVQKFNVARTGARVIFSLGLTDSNCYTHIGWNAAPYQRGIYSALGLSLDNAYTYLQEIWGSTQNNLTKKLWVNSNSQSITNATNLIDANLKDILIGNDTFSSWFGGDMQEAIYWNSTKSDSDLVGINTNQNTYFNVY